MTTKYSDIKKIGDYKEETFDGSAYEYAKVSNRLRAGFATRGFGSTIQRLNDRTIRCTATQFKVMTTAKNRNMNQTHNLMNGSETNKAEKNASDKFEFLKTYNYEDIKPYVSTRGGKATSKKHQSIIDYCFNNLTTAGLSTYIPKDVLKPSAVRGVITRMHKSPSFNGRKFSCKFTPSIKNPEGCFIVAR